MTDVVMGSLKEAIGFSLVQFIWQGAACAGVVAMLLALFRRATPQTRYGIACIGLAVMAALPVATTLRTGSSVQPRASTVDEAGAALPAAGTSMATAPRADQAGASNLGAILSPTWLAPYLPKVTTIWSVGVLLSSLHLFRGWWRLRRARRLAAPLESPRWTKALEVMAARLGVTRTIALVESAFTDGPAVIGHLRPVILVPAAALSGLSPQHVEAILAHELAHIRRADYLVNLAQCAVETLLFYHPAVWWLSGVIRRERELCCDDVAVAACRDRLQYAQALASLEELRGVAATFAVAADGGDLVARIRRIVGDAPARSRTRSGGLVMTMMMTMLVFAIGSGVTGMMADPAAEVQNTEPPAVVVAQSVVAPLIEVQTPVKPAIVRAQRPTAPSAQDAPVPADVATAAVSAVIPIEPQAAQTARGSLEGRVIDQSGGAIPGANVRLEALGSTRGVGVVTNAAGRFKLDDLAPGQFDLMVSIAGFRQTRSRITIAADRPTVIDVRLQVAGVMESVSVRSTDAVPTRTGTAADYFDAARVLGEQGKIAEAEAMAARAIAVLRSQMPETQTTAMPSPPQVAAGPVPIRVGGDIRPPRKTQDVRPIYPADAAAAQVTGVVVIDATIGKDGSVASARVLRGVALLNDAALNAVRGWQFTPTLLNGQPVEVTMTVMVSFER